MSNYGNTAIDYYLEEEVVEKNPLVLTRISSKTNEKTNPNNDGTENPSLAKLIGEVMGEEVDLDVLLAEYDRYFPR
jgi:hypothetical protein